MPEHQRQVGAKPASGGLLQTQGLECLFQVARREAGFARPCPCGAPGFARGESQQWSYAAFGSTGASRLARRIDPTVSASSMADRTGTSLSSSRSPKAPLGEYARA